MANKKHKAISPCAGKHRAKLILAALLLVSGLVLGGKYLIQDRVAETTVVIVPALSEGARLGMAVFKTHCASCHGENGAGSDQGPPLIHEIYRPDHHGDFSFIRAASLGVVQHHWLFGAMPPLPQVTKREVEQIIVYIRELQRANGIH